MSEKIENGHEGPLQLDVPTMEKRVVHYPEGLREPVLWLASFADKECRRDLDLLGEIAKRVGVEMDKSTWSRILRGRWNRSAKGTVTQPLVNEARLLKAIEALRHEAQRKERGGRVGFVNTSRAQTIFDFLDALRAPDRVNKFGIIVGRTGTEKSESLKEYCRRKPTLSCVHIEAPARPSLTAFVRDLASRYQGRNTNWQAMHEKISESVNETRTIMVDNIQRLYVEDKKGDQPVFNFLQKLQDDTRCTVVLSMTPVFAKTLVTQLASGYFEQFIGRAGGVHEFLQLPDWATDEDVLKIAKAFDLQDAHKHAEELVRLSREPGLIRILFGVLQKAKVSANAGKEKLTIEHVKEAIGDEGALGRIFKS